MIGAKEEVIVSMISNEKRKPDPDASENVGETTSEEDASSKQAQASNANASEPPSNDHITVEASRKTDPYGRFNDTFQLISNFPDDILHWDWR